MIKVGDTFKAGFETYEISSMMRDIIEMDGNLDGDEIKIFVEDKDINNSFVCKHYYDGEEMLPCDLNIYEMRMCIEIIDKLKKVGNEND
jgi:hypothetical protein